MNSNEPMKPNAKDYEVRIWYSSHPGDLCYVAQVVDLPGTMTHGDTREEAARRIQSALEATLQSYTEDGETPPAPRKNPAKAVGKVKRVKGLKKRQLAST